MEHIAAVLLIVGCSNSLEQCHELPLPVSIFETVAECATARRQAVAGLANRQPRIFSRCLSVDPALEDDYDTITWHVRRDGTFDASVDIAGVMVASNGARNHAAAVRQE